MYERQGVWPWTYHGRVVVVVVVVDSIDILWASVSRMRTVPCDNDMRDVHGRYP